MKTNRYSMQKDSNCILIFAHHVSHAGEATLVHRVVPPQKKQENENDEGMDEQNENKRRSLLYDRDGPSDGPSGEPSESNSRAKFPGDG